MQPSAASDADYYHRLGLDFDPFAPDAMPDFFFVGAQRRFLVQRAVHALYFSGAMVLLLGADGTGKTRTLTEIEKELQGLVDICHIDATVLMNAAEIRALLTEKLGVPRSVAIGNAELVHALEQIRPANGDPQPVLIAIDAAQLLSIESLADCAALVASAGGRLRLLLAGEADLQTAWRQAQLGAVETLELKTLDRTETEDFVRTKLQAAGVREESSLNDAQFDQLFAQSGGNFAAINSILPLLLQPQPQTPPIAHRFKTLPILHIGIAAVLLAVVIVVMLYRSGDSPSSAQLSTSQQAISRRSAERAETVTAKNGIEQNTVALQLPAASPPTSAMTIDTPAAAATSTPATAPAQNLAATAENSISETNKIAPDANGGKITAEPKPPAEKNISAIEKTAEKKAAAKMTIESKSIQQGKAAAEKNNDKANSTDTSALSADERELLAQPSSHYVLQLIGAESKTTIDKFAKGAGKGLKLYYYRTQLRGKRWFIAVTGPYVDKNAAQVALTKLPETVRKQQPWPRTLANVQADIRARSGH